MNSILPKSPGVNPQTTSTIQLSDAQQAAVMHHGPLAVQAGAGSGKTTVLAHRIAQLIHDGAEPFAILVVTFSVKAAQELRDRLGAMLSPEQTRLISVCTLHSLGLRLLRESGHWLGYGHDERARKPAVCSDAWAKSTLQSVIAEVSKSCPTLNATEVAEVIKRAKAQGQTPNQFAARVNDAVSKAITQCYAAYQAELLRANIVDLDDLILQPVRLLAEHLQVRDFYQARWQYVLCDEAQDLSVLQYQLLREISTTHRNLTLIGDTLQSIYGFRGALGEAIYDQFRIDFPDGKHITLAENFRSSASIVGLSDALLRDYPRRQHAIKVNGLPVTILSLSSEHQEAELVASEIARATAHGIVRHEQCAVLCRTNAQIPPLEQALLKRNLPYTIVGQGSFYDHPEIRGLIAALRLSQDFNADPLALRDLAEAVGLGAEIQRKLIGDAPELLAEHLFDVAHHTELTPSEREQVIALQLLLLQLDERKDATPSAIIAHLSDTFRTAQTPAQADRVNAFTQMAEPHMRIGEFLDELDLQSGHNPLSTLAHDRVHVMTLHQAKGLEFKLVFLIGMEDGLIPHANVRGQRGMDEELRLAYVGMTRAMDALCISFAHTRNGRRTGSSPFLRGLPMNLVSFKPFAWA